MDLNQHLVSLLDGHGVEAAVVDDRVVVEPNGATAVLGAERTNPHALLFSLRATSPDGVVLPDLWAGLGSDDAAAVRDGIAAFCRGTFHVYLAAAWGVLETDQVDHVEVTSSGRPWDLYVGGVVGRTFDRASLPVPSMWDPFIEAVGKVLAERDASVVGRLYSQHRDAKMTFEALVNGEPSEVMETFWRALPWCPSAAGYASQRLLWMAVPRLGERPAHIRVGRCVADG